jgi:hypothetical protein
MEAFFIAFLFDYLPFIYYLCIMMEKSHLEIAKQLIELKFNVKVLSIEFEDGSGRSFNIVTKSNPDKKQWIRL